MPGYTSHKDYDYSPLQPVSQYYTISLSARRCETYQSPGAYSTTRHFPLRNTRYLDNLLRDFIFNNHRRKEASLLVHRIRFDDLRSRGFLEEELNLHLISQSYEYGACLSE